MAEFNPKEYEKWRKEQEEVLRLTKENTGSMKEYLSAQANAIKLSQQLNYQQGQLNKKHKELKDSIDEINRLEKIKIEGKKNGVDLSNEEKIEIENQISKLKTQNKILAKQNGYHQNLINSYKKQLGLINKSLNSWKAIGGVLVNEIGKGLKNNFKWFLEQDKEVRKTQLSMGILSDQAKSFSMNIYKASSRTQILGASAKDLAIMQRDYSEQLGRSVVLSEQGLVAMAEMAKGTTLGAEGAAQLAASMDNFGISATGARDIVQETVDAAHVMGVNASVATKNMLNNMGLAQKYHFKGGIKGMIEMANRAAKFKLDMAAVAGFAENLFSPEGAIDAAAQLQVLGGSWAKLADPFKLMYQARHDMDGLHKSIVEATVGTAQFNRETQELDISGMELHRLREVAKATGIDFEQLSQSAKEVAKYKDIKANIRADVDPKYHDFLTSVAQYNKEKKGYFLEIGGKTKNINELTNLNKAELDKLILQKEALEKRAKEAQSLDELWGNLKDTFKATLLPFLKGVELGLREPLNGFIDWMKKEDVTTKIKEFSEKVGNFAISIGKFIANNPFTALFTAIGGIGLFELGKWYLNGVALRAGFNSGGGFGGGIGGPGGGTGGGIGGLFNKTSKATELGKGLSGKMGKFGKWGVGKGLGIGLATGVGGMALDYGRSQMDDPYSTAGKAMGVGSSALYGAGLGATFGSVIPVIGTAGGAIIGSALGAGYGLMNEWNAEDPRLVNKTANDVIMRPGEKAQPFASNDTVMAFKKGGPIEKSLNDTDTTSKSIEVAFKPLTIEFGPLTIKSDNSQVKLDLNKDPLLAREIASIVQQELRKAIGGGKLNPNPVKA